MFLSVVVAFAALFAEPEFQGPLLGVRVGRIIIEGNTDTPDRVVYDLLDLRPGEKIRFGVLQESRQRLRACPAFQTNPWRGIGPVVEFLHNELDNKFWDVRIQVVDRPGSWLGYSLSDLLGCAMYGMVLHVAFREPEAFKPFHRELEYIVDRLSQKSDQEP